MSPTAQMPSHTPQRTWPAILVLFLLPGLTAEALTGSTPILVYLTNPFSFITNTLLYGSGALLIREVVRRRHLGWRSIMLLGLAYGILEEGLVVNTWVNPWLPQVCTVVNGKAMGICDYSRVASINVSWALSLTVFHAIVSITIPILLVELLFPLRADRPWLGRKAPWAFVGAELLMIALGLLLNVVSYRQHGFAGPLIAPYLLELALMALFIALALRQKPGTFSTTARRPPRLMTLRIFGFVAILVNMALTNFSQGAHLPYMIELLLNALFLALVIRRVTTWSQRQGWNARHQLALASGTLSFIILLLDPIIELSGSANGQTTRGTLIWAIMYLIFLIVLSRRVGKRVNALPPAPPLNDVMPALAPWSVPSAGPPSIGGAAQ